MIDSNKSQEERILWTLQAAWPNWVPAPELSRIALGYGRAIHYLRRKKGWEIANKVEFVDGKKHGFFRLGPRPIPSSKELRRGPSSTDSRAHKVEQTLFGDISPDRTYQE